MHIKNILLINGFAYVWNDQDVDDEKAFIESCYSNINNSSRCRMYMEVKLAYGSGPYLNCKMSKQLSTQNLD